MPEEQIANLSRHKIAMLIDGDNAQSSLLPQMLVETGKYGMVTVRRIYGDWTTASMNSWKDVLNFHAIQPIQQFRYTIGKNATDSAMIIDAMDILHSQVVEGFCLVSSDSDYTRLATRIRETGIFVMGIGEKKTPKPFVNACDVFVYTENLVSRPKPAPQKQRTPRPSSKKKGEAPANIEAPVSAEAPTSIEAPAGPDPELFQMLQKAFEIAVQEDGWARLDLMGSALYQMDPGFDPRTYGHRQLSRLVGNLKDLFEMRTQITDGSTLFYVRMKE
jgi:hypothetical protein